MINFQYSPLMMRRVNELLEEARKYGSGKTKRQEWAAENVGLTYNYLSRIGRKFMHPSARVLELLGMEIWVRDSRTGEMEKLELEKPWQVNPRI